MNKVYIYDMSVDEYKVGSTIQNMFVESTDHQLSSLIYHLEKQGKALISNDSHDNVIQTYSIKVKDLIEPLFMLIQENTKRPNPFYNLVRLNTFYYLSFTPEKELTVVTIDES